MQHKIYIFRMSTFYQDWFKSFFRLLQLRCCIHTQTIYYGKNSARTNIFKTKKQKNARNVHLYGANNQFACMCIIIEYMASWKSYGSEL